jgi:hypothetical protein
MYNIGYLESLSLPKTETTGEILNKVHERFFQGIIQKMLISDKNM